METQYHYKGQNIKGMNKNELLKCLQEIMDEELHSGKGGPIYHGTVAIKVKGPFA